MTKTFGCLTFNHIWNQIQEELFISKVDIKHIYALFFS